MMTPTQTKALEAVTKWQNALLPGTPEHKRALIAGTMIMTILPLTDDQLGQIYQIINR